MAEPPSAQQPSPDILSTRWWRPSGRLPTSLTNLIPTEIFERIIDHLYDDIPTLTACTLVCWSWFTRSRYHLFTDVCLDSRRTDEFLQAFDPKTFRAMRGLTVNVPRALLLELESAPSPSQPEDPLQPVCAILPNLEYLCLAGFPSSPPLSLWLGNYQNTLTHLVIQNILFDTIGNFISAISKLHVLRHLGVEHVCWLGLDLPSPGDFPVSEALCSLSFEDAPGIKVVQWILGRCNPPPVTRLYLHAYDVELSDAVAMVYKSLVSSLQYINVTKEVLKYVKLSSFPQLRHVIFSDIHIFQERSAYARQLKSHISNITSTKIETLVFRIAIDDLSQLQNIDWKGIVQLLNEPRFANLRRIDFSLGLFSRQAKHIILQHFLKSWLKKRLHFISFDVLRSRVFQNWP